MFVQELFENTSRHASFCFGRMNPPTLGHKELLRTVEANSEGGDYYIFASKTHKLPDNPLDYNTKFKFLQAMFPEYAEHMVYDPNLKNYLTLTLPPSPTTSHLGVLFTHLKTSKIHKRLFRLNDLSFPNAMDFLYNNIKFQSSLVIFAL